MFDYESMLKRAAKFFPVWSDIRKRFNKSNGGKLITSVTDEFINIEKSIQEYIDYYFLNKYEENNKDVIAFAYRANIGIINNISTISVIYNNNNYEVSRNIKDFENDINTIYYENGYIYIREELYIDNKITVVFNNSSLDYNLEKYHIWNIYDEFACFLGMQRHENETNNELYKRMLYFNSNKPNASEKGLKDAIISELIIYEPDISYDDIIIEKVNAENLRKPYDDYNELLDKLNEINKDVYRWKRWDLDDWLYDFKTLEYLPYKWNETLVKWQNGIGYDDDLNVIISSNTNNTNLTVSLYEKSQDKLLSYIQNNDIYKTIGFNLKRYNNILKAINVNYKIKASRMAKINPTEFKINIYENSYVNEKIKIEDIYSLGQNISKIDNNTITDIFPYKLEFLPKDNNYNMEIKKCRVLYKKNGKTDHIKDLLIQNNNFILNSLGYLVNNSNKKIINNINNLNTYDDLKDIDNNKGITLSNNAIQGSGSFSINGFGGNKLNYICSCEMSPLPKEYIQYNSADCIWNNKDKSLLLINNNKPKTIDIDIIANKLSFDISCDNSVIVYTYNYDTNNWNPETIVGHNTSWQSEETREPKRIKVKIESNSNDNVTINNFMYSKYEITFDTSINKIYTDQNNNLILPNVIENMLYFKIISYSGKAPILNGIYIGEDLSNLSYITEPFTFENGFTRVLEIESNCIVNLHKMNLSNDTISTINDYDSSTLYKGTSDNSYIKLNLDKYNYIESIVPNNGSIKLIEESGVTKYYLTLNNEEAVSYVNIIGNKNIEKTTITLSDMISFYYPSFDLSKDTVYCSKLAKGLIISSNGANNSISLLQLDSNLFKGSNIFKYEFTSKPDTLEIIWGIDEYNANYNFTHTGDFEYISFYEADSEIHIATNETNMIMNEMKNVKVVKNFNPSLNTSILNYYEIETDDSIDVRFYNYLDEDIPFDKLKRWSVGLKDLYIKCDIDLLNSITYGVSESYILDEVKLNQLIPIDKYYNNNTIQTNKYIVEPIEDMEVIYRKYDGVSDDLLIKEVVEIGDTGFKKLEYSNIDKIFYIGQDISGTIDTKDQFTDYTLLDKEGILIWNNINNNTGTILYVLYSIKEPIALKLSDEYLYKAISYNINAYKQISQDTISNLKNNDVFNLNKLEKFNECDLIYTSCSEPTFEATLINDMIYINKYSQENNILVKTGYYYINGKEYYLFSNKDTLELNTNNNMYAKNISNENGSILTYKATDNRIRNSAMDKKGLNNLFNFDYRDELVYGISNFNKYTACDSFDKWISSNMTISFTDKYKDIGCNDIALEFKQQNEYGYAFIELTDYLYDDKKSYISFVSNTVDVYIGKSNKDIKAFNIDLDTQIKSSTSLKIHEIVKEIDTRYYLVILNNGVLDDIVISDNLNDVYNSHNKNIDLLGFDLKDTKEQGDIYRIEIPNNNYYTSNCADIHSDGLIKTTSNIDWDITEILRYDTYEDWLSCYLDNIIIENNSAITKDSTGYITIEEPIFIENPYTVNRLFININNLNIKSMTGIKIYIYTSNERNGQYRLYTFIENNYGFVYGDYISRYIKLKIEMPKDKIMSSLSVYAEYKSKEPNIINAETLNTGYITSIVYNSQQKARYKLKELNISDISDPNDIEIYIRGCNENVWTSWKLINDNYDIIFNNVQLFQVKILLKSKYAHVKFNYIDLEVM